MKTHEIKPRIEALQAELAHLTGIRITGIKALRTEYNMGLKEAKELYDGECIAND